MRTVKCAKMRGRLEGDGERKDREGEEMCIISPTGKTLVAVADSYPSAHLQKMFEVLIVFGHEKTNVLDVWSETIICE